MSVRAKEKFITSPPVCQITRSLISHDFCVNACDLCAVSQSLVFRHEEGFYHTPIPLSSPRITVLPLILQLVRRFTINRLQARRRILSPLFPLVKSQNQCFTFDSTTCLCSSSLLPFRGYGFVQAGIISISLFL